MSRELLRDRIAAAERSRLAAGARSPRARRIGIAQALHVLRARRTGRAAAYA